MTDYDKDEIIGEIQAYIDDKQRLLITELDRLVLMIDKLEARCARIESKLCELGIRLGHNVCAPRRV